MAGFRVGKGGVLPDPDKMKALRDFPVPTHLTELQAFLGLANQFGMFYPDMAPTLPCLCAIYCVRGSLGHGQRTTSKRLTLARSS